MESYAVSDDSQFFASRIHPEKDYPEDIIISRAPFQRDRDRIIHSRAFRRMMHKTQVFNANKGDHYRNRLTHTLEVSQIARSIGKYLGLHDELVEAIALGHDLGHTPFGHIGERTLDEILVNGIPGEVRALHQNFKHNFQSVRVVDKIETRCNDYLGINLTLATREGILKHTKVKDKEGNYYRYPDLDLQHINLDEPSFTLEGQVVGIADEIAQCTHDLEDGVRSKAIDFMELTQQSLVKKGMEAYGVQLNSNSKMPDYDTRNLIIKHLVGFLINDVCRNSKENIEKYVDKMNLEKVNDYIFKEQCIDFSDEIEPLVKSLKSWMNEKILYSEEVSISDSKSEYLIKQLFKAFYKHPLQLPDYMLLKYCNTKGITFSRVDISKKVIELQQDDVFVRMIADHIGGMTDQFASRTYKKLYYPDYI
jgi:dGTPase